MNTRKNDLLTMTWQMTLMSLRYLNGRRLRTILTTLAIVFGVALIFSINLVLPTITNAFKQGMTTMTGADISITSATGEAFDPSVLEQVAAVSQVRAVTGIYRRTFTLPSIGTDKTLGEAAEVEFIGLDLNTVQNVHQFVVSEGRFLEEGESGKVLIPAGLADFAPELQLGITFPLITAGGIKLYTLIGLVAEEGNINSPEIYMSLSDAQAAFNQEGLINNIEVSIEAGADQSAVSDAILRTLGTGFVLNQANDVTTTFASLQIGFTILNLFGVLALFLGAFLIFNTFRTVVLERRHDIGMLRAIGATQTQIMTMFVIESLIQGIIGTAIGLVLGYFLATGLMISLNQVVSNYLHVGYLNLQWNANAFAMAIGLGLLTSLVAGYLPARAASKTSPLEALRPSPTAGLYKAARWNLLLGGLLMLTAVGAVFTGSQGAVYGALIFLIGMVVASPALVMPAAKLFGPMLSLWFAREGDLARGNLTRQPGRAAITASTLMVGLAVMVMMGALVSGFGSLITDLANNSFSSDIILMPQTLGIYANVIGADESLGNRLSEIPEVETVSSLRYAASTTNEKSLQVLGIDPTTYPQVASFTFNQGTAESAFPALSNGRNAIVTSLAMSSLELQMDSDFVIQTADGPQTYHVVAVANDLLTFKIAGIFVSQDNLAADFHKEEDVLLLLNLLPDADSDAAMGQVQTIVADYPQFTAHLTGEYRQEIVNLSTGYLGLFYILALLILIPSALGLLNTLSINIMERTREIGVVRAIGGSRGQVQRIVAAEALLLGIFSAAMGVLTGVVISYGFVMAFDLIGWQMPFVFPIIGVVAAIIVAVLLALFASILPARNAAKLDIIKALQYE